MYHYVCAGARGSLEWSRLTAEAAAATERTARDAAFPNERPMPLRVWRHPYTWESNGAAPNLVFDWASNLAQY